MPTLHAQLVLSEEGHALLKSLQPGQHLNLSFQIAPPVEEEHHEGSTHAGEEKQEFLDRPTYAHYQQPHSERGKR